MNKIAEMVIFTKIGSISALVLCLAEILSLAVGQGTEDLNVWNVYCSGDGSECAIAQEPVGELMFTQFAGKVDWETAQAWMVANGYPRQPAVWNVYCNGDLSQCTIAQEPAGELMFPQFVGAVNWDAAQAWMESWRRENQPEVWNVYCNGSGLRCEIAKEPVGELMFPVFAAKVDWETAQEWLATWMGDDKNATGQSMPIGNGTSYNYNGSEFQVEGVSAMVNAEQTYSSIDLQGMSARAVHVLEFAGWSIGVPDGVKVAHIDVLYQDGGSETADLIFGTNIAEWAYDRPEVQSDLQHSKVAPAYNWSTTAGSSYEYQGHYFYVGVDTDPERPLDRLDLVLDYTEEGVQIEIRAVTLEA